MYILLFSPYFQNHGYLLDRTIKGSLPWVFDSSVVNVSGCVSIRQCDKYGDGDRNTTHIGRLNRQHVHPKIMIFVYISATFEYFVQILKVQYLLDEVGLDGRLGEGLGLQHWDYLMLEVLTKALVECTDCCLAPKLCTDELHHVIIPFLSFNTFVEAIVHSTDQES